MSDRSASHASLKALFEGVHAQRLESAPSPPSMNSIRVFFERLHRQRLSDPPGAPPEPVFNRESLASFFQAFPALHRRQLRSGAFVNPWGLAGLGRDEVRNSAVLAWLFDPQGSHSFGSDILHTFLSVLRNDSCQNLALPLDAKTPYVVFREKYSLSDDTNRVDLLVEGDAFVIYIEVKIDAVEGPEQIGRYLESVRRRAQTFGKPHHALVYLTQDQRKPRDCTDERIFLASWKDVIAAIETVLKDHNISPSDPLGLLLTSLTHHLRTL
jgi:hypothetical protein